MNPLSRGRTGSGVLLGAALILFVTSEISAAELNQSGCASWYGEEHRGRLMANGKPFNPDHLTAASWNYPLGTKLRVEFAGTGFKPRSVVVTVTDRGPALDLVRKGRVIDLSLAAFRHLSSPDLGLVPVSVHLLDTAKGPKNERTIPLPPSSPL